MKLTWAHQPDKNEYEAKIHLGPWFVTTARVSHNNSHWQAIINGCPVTNPTTNNWKTLKLFDNETEAMQQVEDSIRDAALALAESLGAPNSPALQNVLDNMTPEQFEENV
jgi:hypothetical protein